MGVAPGKVVNIGLKIEATRGTAETSADFYLPKMSFSLDEKAEFATDDSSIGILEDNVGKELAKTWAEGSFEGAVGDKTIGVLLYAFLGAAAFAVDTPEAGVNTHTFTVQQAGQQKSVTVFVEGDGQQDEAYALGIVTELGIVAEVGQIAKVNVSFRSKIATDQSLTPSYVTDNTFSPNHISVKIANAISGITGASAFDVQRITLNLTKEVDDEVKLGTAEIQDILTTKITVSGEIEFTFKDEVIRDLYRAGTSQAMEITLKNTDVTLGSAANPTLTITLSGIKFTDFSRDIGNDSLIRATVPFEAFYNRGESTPQMIKAVVVNTNGTYIEA